MMLVEQLPVLLLGLFVLSLADYGTGSENMSEIISSLENISEILFNNGYNSWGNTIRKAISLLKEQDNCENCAIAIEDRPLVVRCKDCKHWYFADNRIPSEQENVCGRNGTVVTPDWFCADGNRKGR